MMEMFELSLRLLTSLALLTSLIWVVGIVWRVEAELDTAYKWFSLSVVFFALSELFEVLPAFYTLTWGGVALSATRFLAALALGLGMYFMRDLVRRMDGEKAVDKQR